MKAVKSPLLNQQQRGQQQHTRLCYRSCSIDWCYSHVPVRPTNGDRAILICSSAAISPLPRPPRGQQATNTTPQAQETKQTHDRARTNRGEGTKHNRQQHCHGRSCSLIAAPSHRPAAHQIQVELTTTDTATRRQLCNMSRPAPAAAAAAAAAATCPICCLSFPSSFLSAHADQCFDAMAADYIAAIPSISGPAEALEQAVLEASKRTASAEELAAPGPPPPPPHRKNDPRAERQLLVIRAEQLLSLAELDQAAAAPAHLLQPGDALASALHALKARHSASLHLLCKQLRAQIATLHLGDSNKLHLVAALKLALFALEADALSADGPASVQRTSLELGKLPPLSHLEWLHRFAECYFLHQSRVLDMVVPIGGESLHCGARADRGRNCRRGWELNLMIIHV